MLRGFGGAGMLAIQGLFDPELSTPERRLRADFAFCPLPHFQQLPDLGLPRFQLGNVVLIATPGTVDAAADLVNVRGDSADGGSQLLLPLIPPLLS